MRHIGFQTHENDDPLIHPTGSPFVLEVFEKDRISVRDLRVNQAMHSRIGPWEEANQIYVQTVHHYMRPNIWPDTSLDISADQCSADLVIYDIGLGIGANALAMLEWFSRPHSDLNYPRDSLQLISFENDLRGLQFALDHFEHFGFLQKHESLIRKLLRNRQVHLSTEQGKVVKWDLVLGDFRDALTKKNEAISKPDWIFFDLYSPKTCPELWSEATFQMIHDSLTHTPAKTTRRTGLITYSSASSVRKALTKTGFRVLPGPHTAMKRETTVAFIDSSEGKR